MIGGFDAAPESIAYKAFIDWTLVFGLDLFVIGAALLYASRDKLRGPTRWPETNKDYEFREGKGLPRT